MYMTLATSDGLIFTMHEPIEGRMYDLTTLRHSVWEGILKATLALENEQFCVNRDAAFTLLHYLILPFNQGLEDAAEMAFNTSMSAIRVAVE